MKVLISFLFFLLLFMTSSNTGSKLKHVYFDTPIKISLSQVEVAQVAFESIIQDEISNEHMAPAIDKDKNEKTLVSGQIDLFEQKKDFLEPIKISRTDIVFNDRVVSELKPGVLDFPQPRSKPEKVFKQTVRGKIENSSGLPHGGGFRIKVSQVHDNKVIADGEVNAEYGEYQLQFNNFEGQIKAELIDEDNKVIGLDSYPAQQIQSTENQYLFVGKKLLLKPVGTVASNSNVGSSKNQSPKNGRFDNGNIYKNIFNRSNGTSSDLQAQRAIETVTQNFKRPSTTLIEASGEDAPPALFLADSANSMNLRSIDNLYIDSIRKIIESQTNSSYIDPSLGVIFGRVTLGNENLIGAQVELEGMDVTPVYFNTMMPDISLPATSENGTFVIFNVPTGYYSLKVNVIGQYWSHENIVVRNGSVSQLEVRSNLSKSTNEIESKDPFLNVSVKSNLTIQAIDGPVSVSEVPTQINLQNIDRDTMYTVEESGEYAAHFGYFRENDKQIVIPRVKTNWLRGLTEKIRNPEHGVIVGFVDYTNYEVFLPHEADANQVKQIYFDSNGFRVEKSVAGGGFILINVPTDVQSVLVYDQDAEQFQSQVLPVDPESLAVLVFKNL